MTMGLEGDFAAGLDQLAETLKGPVIASGANTMAYTFQVEAQYQAPVFAGQERFVPRSKSGKSGGYKITPGQLRDSIYRVHSDDDSNDGLQVYEVSWNHYKAPHGYWMEFGNARHPAHPFIRPAYEAAKQRAVQAGISRMAVKFAEARQVQ
jgi:HK97 gp10 family phage protein